MFSEKLKDELFFFILRLTRCIFFKKIYDYSYLQNKMFRWNWLFLFKSSMTKPFTWE